MLRKNRTEYIEFPDIDVVTNFTQEFVKVDTTMIAGYYNINDDFNNLDFHLLKKADKKEITLSTHMNDDFDKDGKITSERL
jgi:hypothetical protein